MRVLQAPAITSLNTVTFSRRRARVLHRRHHRVTLAEHSLETGTLPAGLTLVDNGNGTATLSGTPTGPGGETTVGLLPRTLPGTARNS